MKPSALGALSVLALGCGPAASPQTYPIRVAVEKAVCERELPPGPKRDECIGYAIMFGERAADAGAER